MAGAQQIKTELSLNEFLMRILNYVEDSGPNGYSWNLQRASLKESLKTPKLHIF